LYGKPRGLLQGIDNIAAIFQGKSLSAADGQCKSNCIAQKPIDRFQARGSKPIVFWDWGTYPESSSQPNSLYHYS